MTTYLANPFHVWWLYETLFIRESNNLILQNIQPNVTTQIHSNQYWQLQGFFRIKFSQLSF